MNRLNQLVQAVRGTKGLMEDFFLKNMSPGGNDGLQVMSHAYSKMELVYICISTTARAISQVPLVVTNPPKSGSETRRPVGMDNPWQRRIFSPNSTMDENSFKESLIGYLLLDGEVFVIPYPPQEKYDVPPASLYIVRKKYMEPIRDKNGQLIGWTYSPYIDAKDNVLKNTKLNFSYDEVSHAKLWNPYDPLRGLSPLEAGRLSLLSDYRALQYNDNFFQEGAVPGGMLYTDQKLSGRTFNRIREQFDEHHKGVGASHKVAVLEQGLKYTQSGLSHKDMEFLELRRYSRETIMQIFGMKASILSISNGGVPSAEADMEKKEWWQSTNLPLIKLLESALNRAFFPNEQGIQLVFDVSNVEALHENYADRVKTGALLFKMGFTAQEVNERLNLGFDSKPWRKKWYIPTNMAPVNDDGTAYIQNPTGPGAPGQMTPNNTPAPQTPPPAPGEGAPKPKKPKKGLEEGSSQALLHAGAVKGLLTLTEPLSAQYESRLSRLFFEMRKDALSSLHASPDSAVGFSFPKATENIRKYTKELYKEAITLGYTSVRAEKEFDNKNEESLDFLARKSISIVGIVNTIHRQISIQISQGVARKETKEDLANRVKQVFNNAGKRTKSLADMEIWSTMNFGRYLSIKENFEEKTWVAVGDSNTRESHKEMDGTVISTTDLWKMSDGSVLRYPGDLRGRASQVLGCRCIEMPFTK